MKKTVDAARSRISPHHTGTAGDDPGGMGTQKLHGSGEDFNLPLFQRFRLQSELVIRDAPHHRPDAAVAPDAGGLLKGVPQGVSELVVVVDIKRTKGVVPHMGAVINGVPVGRRSIPLTQGREIGIFAISPVGKGDMGGA